MNKTIVIAAIFILVLGGGVFVTMQNSSQNEDAMMTEETVMENAMMGDGEDQMDEEHMTGDVMDDARYVAYSQTAFNNASDGRRVLFFYANWCPTCRPANADFMENMSQIPEDVTVIRVNYNDDQTSEEEEALANTYDVTYQHTFVQIDGQGNAVTTWNGGGTEELLSHIQ